MELDRGQLSTVTATLAAAGCVAADEEARELIYVAADAGELAELVARRGRGEPLAWVVGATVFCGRTVRVDPGVFVPRAQSESLARRAATRLAATTGHARAVDLCTGAGAIAAHLASAVPAAAVVGVELDARAARCARRNGVATVVADLDVPMCPCAFDVVTAVAPYVPTGMLRYLPRDTLTYEPRVALDGGTDGLDVVRRVVTAAAGLLRRGGSLFVEVGGDQARELAAPLDAAGFDDVETWADDDGELRGLAARRVR